MRPNLVEGQSMTHNCGRTGPPDLRLVHYNDVYHIEYDLPVFVSKAYRY